MLVFKSWRNKILAPGLATVAAAVWTFALLYSQNILFFNRHWVPYNSLVLGLHETLVARHPVSGFALRSHKSGVRTRLLSTETFPWSRISIRADLGKNGILQFGIFKDEADGFDISTNEHLPIRRFRSDLHEKILRDQRLKQVFKPGKIQLTLEREGPFARLFADGVLVYQGPNDFPEGRIFIEAYATTVNEVRVSGEGFTEDLAFSREENFWKFFVPTALVFVGLSLMTPVQIPLTLLLAGLLWTSYDFFYHSRQVFRFNMRTQRFTSPASHLVDVEHIRHAVFAKWYTLFGGDIVSKEKILRKFGHRKSTEGLWHHTSAGSRMIEKSGPFSGKSKVRVLIFGGSMTSGWGTTSPERAYAAVLRRKLQESLACEVEVASFTSFNQFGSGLGTEDAKAVIKKFRPQILIFDLVPRNTDEEVLRLVIEMRKSFRLIMLRPPFDLIASTPELVESARRPGADLSAKSFHPVSELYNVGFVTRMMNGAKPEFVDANRYFLRPEIYLSGHLFRDNFHLSDWGHELLGNFLAEEIARPTPSVFQGP